MHTKRKMTIEPTSYTLGGRLLCGSRPTFTDKVNVLIGDNWFVFTLTPVPVNVWSDNQQKEHQ